MIIKRECTQGILTTVITSAMIALFWEFFVNVKIYPLIFGYNHENSEHFEHLETVVIVIVVAFLSILYPYRRIAALLDKLARENELNLALSVKADEANKAKSNFLASMSHDLRTPLNAIIGFSEVMQREVFGSLANDTYREYVNNIHHSGNQLLTLVNDILNISNLEFDKYLFKDELLNPVEISKQLAKSFENIAQQKNIAINILTTHRTPKKILADRGMITQIQNNLISNACGHTGTGGQITVIWETPNNDEIILSVKDTGEGISKEVLEKLGDPFSSNDAHITRAKDKSIGSGLYICRKLIEIREGRLDFESDVGVGTTVTASWPIEAHHPGIQAK